MKNFISSGNDIQLTAPSGGVVGGDVYKQGDLIGVIVASAAEGERFTLMLSGTFTVPKATNLVITAGDTLYWDNTAKKFNKTATDNTYGGKAYSSALLNDTTVQVRLDN